MLRLRPVGEADLDCLFQIYASTREAESLLLNWSAEAWEAFVRQQFELQHAQYMRGYIKPSFDLILVDEVPVGRLYADRQPQELHIIDIALLPEYRGQGIGGELLRDLLDEARESGCVVGLHVDRDNPVLPFYERLGFRVVQEQGAYLHLRCEAGAWPARQPGRATASSELPD